MGGSKEHAAAYSVGQSAEQVCWVLCCMHAACPLPWQ